MRPVLHPTVAALALASAMGCGGAQPPLAEAPPALDVRNASGGEILVVARRCGSAAPPHPLHAGALPNGTRRLIPLGHGCWDFDALGPDGELVGRQHGVDLRRPMEWRIQ